MAPEVLNDLLSSGQRYGSPRVVPNVAILFSDIRNSTDYAHSATDLEAFAADLSAYLSAITDVIHQHGGFVDKFIGDAVMAFWGYPGVPRPHNDVILACAEAMVKTAARHRLGRNEIRIGIGINQGACFMGNIGSKEKRQFTILGDAVNVASRIEHATKDLGSDLALDKSFFTELSGTQQNRLAPPVDVDIRGAGPHTLYKMKEQVN